MSEPFLASYLRECLQTARQALDAYDAAIMAAPDDHRRHQMVRFAEQSRMRVDILLRVIHEQGFTVTATVGLPTGVGDEAVWWQHVGGIWASECQAYRQIAILQTLSLEGHDSWLAKTVGDLEPSTDERLHVLETHARDSALRLSVVPTPTT
jgi:hypothetical protein